MILEVCCGNLESVHAAVKGGAPRIELCSRLDLDGLSPLWEELEEARGLYPALKIHALIRPREGDFCYCPEEAVFFLGPTEESTIRVSNRETLVKIHLILDQTSCPGHFI